jgi:hypothetical protein
MGKRSGGKEANRGVALGVGRFRPSRNEEFADACEGWSVFAHTALEVSIDFRRLLVCGVGKKQPSEGRSWALGKALSPPEPRSCRVNRFGRSTHA